MKQDNKKTGGRGEKIAEEYLIKKGYRIVECNFGTRFGEIDIVCYDAQTLVFVEVKTKRGHDFGEPEEMVNRNKLNRVKKMGEVYLVVNKMGNVPCRVDVVGIVINDQSDEVERISHFEAIY